MVCTRLYETSGQYSTSRVFTLTAGHPNVSPANGQLSYYVIQKGSQLRCIVCDFQLRYYDDKEDTHCKGFIDLAEVVHVASTKSAAGAPKKADDSAFFEVSLFRHFRIVTKVHLIPLE